jgi:flavin reductase (DIM6/NTAB) family NADH-FMN oxidoreductase RutF
MLTQAQSLNRYTWPDVAVDSLPEWTRDPSGPGLWRSMPESPADVAQDSRWPAFFPSPICLVTTGEGDTVALEKVVGASIVNRFPYLVALSFCKDDLSARHYARTNFCDLLERSGVAAVQFIVPGQELDDVMHTIATVPDSKTTSRIARTGLSTRPSISHGAPVFEQAFMSYEARLVEPSLDFEGEPLFEKPWIDVGSHRIYFLKITTIQLREDVAQCRSQVKWRSLPAFTPELPFDAVTELNRVRHAGYSKNYTPNYSFPAAGTIAFTADYVENGMAVKVLQDALITDNDDARWPCFFPQSAGIITSRGTDGSTNVIPCGSTTIVSRHPLVVAPCISYAAINERYAPRASLDMILKTGWFGCGVPFIDDTVLDAIRYAGNTSLREDTEKLLNTGLRVEEGATVPLIPDLPLFYECQVVGHQRLGTHIILFGEVRRIRVRADVTPENPLEWCPWADVAPAAPRE